ncbi:23S rRNA (pseudouridine(1915)-N(3))-methyltransferase RlmH [Ignatzschineria ureiclastica]|uniref:Ribosomal RNA large subunit methyltransferase H n=1 Tax=Ignatzschineria ureiclastica TaxID=472582 RepID=A0A2U2AGN0_9GAMM|nr:23S rRNA (pseudouridine(1915)-N(3))-methyltransferase RlmH [Ignatzschineria ureiclastica]PWD81811.1 23S rRNA (pseudouridine(1915)-N(3))-methyltransferase RlmH [Ignatzschineria ureiclastica]GGZ90694.1 ribosomal RNA large subunit methyltransferase H [Ignatzschineria ureiclastica]
MVIYLIAVGSNMPQWVKMGYEEYAGRLRADVTLKLIEIPALPRKKNADVKRILKEEGEKLQKAIPKGAMVVGLDVIGQAVTTPQLSEKMASWMLSGRDIALLIGGPEGFSPEIKSLFEQSLSLSKLTLPHPMVRVLVAEQLFRAWSILNNHPYHRE